MDYTMKALLALALGFTALVSPATAVNSDSLTLLVTLRVEVAGEISDLEVVLGEEATIGLVADESHYLVLTPRALPESKSQIHLSVEEVQRIAGFEHRRPVSSGTLEKEHSLAMIGGGLRLEVEYATLSELPIEANLRPVRCCVTCDGVTYCAHCVSAPCGSCCIRP